MPYDVRRRLQQEEDRQKSYYVMARCNKKKKIVNSVTTTSYNGQQLSATHPRSANRRSQRRSGSNFRWQRGALVPPPVEGSGPAGAACPLQTGDTANPRSRR